jgi:Mg2+/citrate symporter
MDMIGLILIIIVALYFGWRMDRLERQIEDVHDSLRKILTLPLDVRQAEFEADLAAKKEQAARQRRWQLFLALLLLAVMAVLVIVGLMDQPGN